MPSTTNDTKKLFKKITDTMKSKGITVYQIHKSTGIPKQTTYDLLNKKILMQQIEHIVKVCGSLGLNVVFQENDND